MTFDPTSPMVFRPQASSAVPPIPSNLNPQSAAPTPIPTSGIPPQLPSPHESAILREIPLHQHQRMTKSTN